MVTLPHLLSNCSRPFCFLPCMSTVCTACASMPHACAGPLPPCPFLQVLSPVLLDDGAPPLSLLDPARLLSVLCLVPRGQLTIQRFGLGCVRLREALASSISWYGHVRRTALLYCTTLAWRACPCGVTRSKLYGPEFLRTECSPFAQPGVGLQIVYPAFSCM